MAKEEKKKIKKPTAKKRLIQSKKKCLINRSFKSKTKTAIKKFKKFILEKDKDRSKNALKKIFSLLDKGVKKNIFKKNRAARIKSKITILEKKL
ncbi:MAG: 30S ribosomal protein S20 [Chlamydiae bacterium SM23_39]|nr:MAG: 30S ribosomal protein S20 [Chlamydiae bacterium SM23_39]